MEKAVSADADDDADRLQVFERGDAIEVPVGRIEAELAALWRRAAEARPGQSPDAVTRACLWNLVVRVHGEAEQFAAAKRIIDELSQRHAGAHHRHAHRAAIGRRSCAPGSRPTGGGAKAAGTASGSDEVTLWAGGQGGRALPSLVRALLVSDAPTAMFWIGGAADAGAGACASWCTRPTGSIVDTRQLADEHGLARAVRRSACAEPELQLADLSWLGISPLRGMCAALFDPPRDPRRARDARRVRVVISNIQGTQARGLLGARLAHVAARLAASRSGCPRPAARARWQAKRKRRQAGDA